MGLFGFGKKKEQAPQQQKSHSFKSLNKRSYPRYILKGAKSSLGEVIDCSKVSLRLVSSGLKVGDYLDVELEGRIYEAEVSRVEGSKVAFRLKEPLFKEFIQTHRFEPLHHAIRPKKSLELESIEHDGSLQENRAIINLMLEIEDPNTNISKFKENIEVLSDLKEKILARANSIEVAGRGRVEDVAMAVSRLGFDEVKKIVYQYITYEVSLSHNELQNFENFEVYNIFMGTLFKKLAPLFNFKDTKNEGQSLLTMSSVAASILSNECDRLLDLYDGVGHLYSFEMRKYEYFLCGYDFLEINRYYFLESLGVFKYLYDGFVLANSMLDPRYGMRNFKIELSGRKLRFAYVTYLVLLGLRYIFAGDKQSGYIFFHRLKRLGFTLSEGKEWINQLIANTNKRLHRVGIEKSIKPIDIPSNLYTPESLLGSGIYTNYFLSRFTELGNEAKRIAIRYEDSMFTHEVLERLLNMEGSHYLTRPFCVVPCADLQDDELPLAIFEGFDLLIFKDIHRLDPSLMQDFMKLWRDFEGEILCTFDAGSMIEYSNERLYELFKEQIVDFPSYAQSSVMQMKMITSTCARINDFFGKKCCDLEEFKDGVYAMESVIAKSFEKEG